MLIRRELEHATIIYTSDLVAKKDFIALKAEVDKYTLLNWLMLQLV